jgi:hypothetical protein
MYRDTHFLYTHLLRPMFCGVCSPCGEVDELEGILFDRNRLLCWRGRHEMETARLVWQMLADATRREPNPTVMAMGSVRSARRLGPAGG